VCDPLIELEPYSRAFYDAYQVLALVATLASGASLRGAEIVGGTGYSDCRNGMWVPMEAVI
jgi:hypothetical protein